MRRRTWPAAMSPARSLAARVLVLAAMLVSATVRAEPAALVEAMQMPAWIERGPVRAPLRMGYELESGDRILTGRGARVLLRLQEGSHVRLGENAQFNIDSLAAPTEPGGVFTGVIDVVRGAFRFTTSVLGKPRRRDVTARVATVTIGIRGTDVWGKADRSRDFVVLLEGAIDIARDGEATQRMEKPLTIFSAPTGAATEAIRNVDADALRRWAAETDLDEGAGVVAPGGGWGVVCADTPDAAVAQALARRLQSAGYAADVAFTGDGLSAMQQVTIGGLRTGGDAERLRQRLERQFSLTDTRVISQARTAP